MKNLLLLLILVGMLYAGNTLNVPEVEQRMTNWCWAGVSEALLQYNGVDVSQEDIVAWSTGSSSNNSLNVLWGEPALAGAWKTGDLGLVTVLLLEIVL